MLNFSKIFAHKCRLNTQVPNKVILTQQVSVVLMNQFSPKLKDPGAPIISCAIGDITIKRALSDLGASVNLLPSSTYDFLLRRTQTQTGHFTIC